MRLCLKNESVWIGSFSLTSLKGLVVVLCRAGGIEDSVTPQDLIISVQFNIHGQVKDVSSIRCDPSPHSLVIKASDPNLCVMTC